MAILPAGALSRIGRTAATKTVNAGKKAWREPGALARGVEPALIRGEVAPVQEINRVVGKDAGTRFDVTQTANTRSATANLVGRAMDIGLYPGKTDIKAASFNDMVRRLNTLDDNAKALATNSFHAKSNLVIASHDPSFGTPAERALWQGIVARAMRNDTIRTAHGQADSIHIATAKAKYDAGITNIQQYTEEVRNVGYLHPFREGSNDADGSMLLGLVKKGVIGGNSFKNRSMLSPDLDAPHSGGGKGTIVDPIESIARKIDNSIRYSGENTSRVEFIDTILKGAPASGSVKKLGPKDKGTGNILKVRRNGATERYQIDNTAVYNVLRYNNHWVMPVGNEMRKWKQWTTTGVFAPQFSFTSLKYDMGLGLIGMRTRNMISGPLDAALKTHFGGDASFGGVSVRDVLAPIVRMIDGTSGIPVGMREAYIGRRSEEMVRQSLRYATDAGLYDKNMPLAQRQAIERPLNKAYTEYADTVFSHLVRSGYTPNIVSSDMAQAGLFDRQVHGRLQKTKSGRAYIGMIDNIKECYRVALFSRNYAFELKEHRIKTGNPNATLSKKQIDRIAYEVRRVAADPSALGSNKAATYTLSTIPFGNTALQSTWFLGQQWNNPAAYSALVWGVGGYMGMKAYIKSNMEEGEYERIVAETPTYKRTMSMMFPKPMSMIRAMAPGRMKEPWTEDDIMWIGLGIELGAYINVGASVTEAVINGVMGNEPEIGEVGPLGVAGQAAMNLMGLATPPLVNFGRAVVGLPEIDFARGMGDRPLEQQAMSGSNELLPDYRGYGLSSGIIGERVAGMIRQLTGVNAAAILDIAETTLDADFNELEEKGFIEGTKDSLGIVIHSVASRNPVLTTIFPDLLTTRDSRGTPLSDQFYSLKSDLNKLVDNERIIRGDGVLGNISDPVHVPDGAMLVSQVRDPELKRQLGRVITYFKSNKREAQLEEISKLERKSGMVKGNLQMGPNRANRAYNDYVGAIADRQRLVLEDYAAFEAKMQEKWPGWTMEKFTTAVVDNLKED